MNRKQKRDFVKSQKKRGVPEKEAKAYAEIISRTSSSEYSPAQPLAEGDKVRLNLERIKARKNFDVMNPKYIEFVLSAGDNVYTVHFERPNSVANLITLKEEPAWLFWSGDLIKVEEEE